MKAKKLIEVALPIKEISAESVRDKSIRNGHISTLHLWWARRPLPVCRAVIFASLVPDPLDENCPQAFKDAVKALLDGDQYTHMMYRPYTDIPYTAVYDPMEDNLRHRLIMFIGKFSDKCSEKMLKGESTPSNEQISDGSLIKCENKNNPQILRIARELIYVAYNAEHNSLSTYPNLHNRFNELLNAIKNAEKQLYSITNRHKETNDVQLAKLCLQNAIDSFQKEMPSILDPFAGGGAIPLEAARLGCRSYGNDINPVAHIIEKGSAEFPQKYGKPIKYTYKEFVDLYGDMGLKLLRKYGINISFNQDIEIPNRLAFDVEYYGLKLIEDTKQQTNHVYLTEKTGARPSVYYWIRHCKCLNCQTKIPLLKQYYLSKPRSNKNLSRIKHFNLSDCGKLEILSGNTNKNPIVKKGNVTCPFCGAVMSAEELKYQFKSDTITQELVALVYDTNIGKTFVTPEDKIKETNVSIFNSLLESQNQQFVERLHPNSAGGDILSWGYKYWMELFNPRQLFVLEKFAENINAIISDVSDDYHKVIKVYLTILLDKIAVRMTSFGKWHNLQDTVEHLFGRQAIQMNYDYPELDPFSEISSNAVGQLSSIVNYIVEESTLIFASSLQNASSGEKMQFKYKELTAVVTDPPYYDAIAYADISDFFYVWMKKTLSDIYPINFSTPQTPKAEECTALKHHHNDNALEAREHFENKLTQIFDAIEQQTSDVVSIMFAHQSTEAWTTLCNSILDARMNITGSWPMDTEKIGALKTDKAFLESSVTVACRPSERGGFADFREVKRDIENKVANEIDKLYELGYRGADLLTACFGQAVSEFGKYEAVEKSNGDKVCVAELLEMARQTAFDSLLKGVQGDELTRFYIGWLQMNGVAETDFDDATKFTRVGVNIEIREVLQRGLLIQNQNKYKVAMSDERPGMTHQQGTRLEDPLIDQAHRLIKTYKEENRSQLLYLIENLAPDATSPLWRLLATLKELLPANDELKQIQGLLVNAESLRQDCHKPKLPEQGNLFDNM